MRQNCKLFLVKRLWNQCNNFWMLSLLQDIFFKKNQYLPFKYSRLFGENSLWRKIIKGLLLDNVQVAVVMTLSPAHDTWRRTEEIHSFCMFTVLITEHRAFPSFSHAVTELKWMISIQLPFTEVYGYYILLTTYCPAAKYWVQATATRMLWRNPVLEKVSTLKIHRKISPDLYS